MLRTIVFCLFSLGLCASAQVRKAAAKTPAGKSALDKTTLEAYIRHQFMIPAALKVLVEEPQPSGVNGMSMVKVVVTDGGPTRQEVPFYITQDGQKIIQGKIFDVKESPFADDLKLLKTDGAASVGPADAPVTMIVFSDFQCQFCKEEAKVLRQHLTGDYGAKTRLVFKDFPLEQIHPWAKAAAIAGRCVLRQNGESFWKYHDWMFEQQGTITAENLKAKVVEFANANSVDALQLGQCLDAKATEAEVTGSADQARALQVASTPTMFVNGRRLVGNMQWEQLKGVLDYELEYAKKNPPLAAAKKKDECCELKLPIPGQK